MTKNHRVLFLLSLVICCLSCGTNKKLTQELVYFKGLGDSSRVNIDNFEPKIEVGDVLYIGVSSSDPKTDMLFNMTNYYQGSLQTSVTGSNNTLGYLVNSNGNVILPQFGAIQAYGKTKTELAEIITARLIPITNEPIVTIRYLNYKVTVIGEVTRPGTFTIPNERINVLEAIGLAGDLTVFGKRNNVLLIREVNGKREFARLDLNRADVFRSPFYYLKQNDIIYIEMNDRKLANTDLTSARTISIITGIVSALSILITAISAITR